MVLVCFKYSETRGIGASRPCRQAHATVTSERQQEKGVECNRLQRRCKLKVPDYDNRIENAAMGATQNTTNVRYAHVYGSKGVSSTAEKARGPQSHTQNWFTREIAVILSSATSRISWPSGKSC